jgi:hypothetical protein
MRIPWSKKPVLTYPIPPAPRTAVLVDGFRSSGNTRVFVNGWNQETATFAPAAIAASPSQLYALCGIRIPSLRNALIALINPGEKRLTDEDRDRLWRAFRVPVFEQRIDESAHLLAAECEAHDGLHIESKDVTPQAGEILETAPCGCGRTTPRLTAVSTRSVAAYAR